MIKNESFAVFMMSRRSEWMWMDAWLKEYITRKPYAATMQATLEREKSRTDTFHKYQQHVTKLGGTIDLPDTAARKPQDARSTDALAMHGIMNDGNDNNNAFSASSSSLQYAYSQGHHGHAPPSTFSHDADTDADDGDGDAEVRGGRAGGGGGGGAASDRREGWDIDSGLGKDEDDHDRDDAYSPYRRERDNTSRAQDDVGVGHRRNIASHDVRSVRPRAARALDDISMPGSETTLSSLTQNLSMMRIGESATNTTTTSNTTTSNNQNKANTTSKSVGRQTHPHRDIELGNVGGDGGEKSHGWSCMACTYLNEGNLYQCSMCETPRPSVVSPQSQSDARPALSHSNSPPIANFTSVSTTPFPATVSAAANAGHSDSAPRQFGHVEGDGDGEGDERGGEMGEGQVAAEAGAVGGGGGGASSAAAADRNKNRGKHGNSGGGAADVDISTLGYSHGVAHTAQRSREEMD